MAMKKDKLFKSLDNPIRIQIMEKLREKKSLRVNDLVIELEVPQSTVSKHLRTLREAGMVLCEEYGTERWYRINDVTLGALTWWMTTMVSDKYVQPPRVERAIIIRTPINYEAFERGFAAV